MKTVQGGYSVLHFYIPNHVIMKEEKEIGTIIDILKEKHPEKEEDFFSKVVDKLLDSSKQVVKNYLIVLKKLIK